MQTFTLYAAPGTCARVPLICLEELGLAYQLEVIRFMTAEHKSAGYKKLNPKGKVPTLLIDGEALTENIAIVRYLADGYPEQRLMPRSESSLDNARQIADLSFCSATLHPIVSRIRMPFMFGGDDPKKIWAAGCRSMVEHFRHIDQRLGLGQWWYGDNWSAMDAYLYWVFWRVSGANFDTEKYPNFCDHAKRMQQRPSVLRAESKEQGMEAILESEGFNFVPPSWSS